MAVQSSSRELTSRGAATRQRIITGAAALLREHGPANVGLDDIRVVTSTSKSQLFHYFPQGKSELLLAVARYEAEQVLAEQQPLLSDLTTWPKWQAWQRRVIANYAAQRQHCPLSALIAQLGGQDEQTRAIVTDLYQRWQDYLVAGIRALKRSGEASREVNARTAARAILAAISGGATLLQATDDISYLQTGLREATQALRHG